MRIEANVRCGLKTACRRLGEAGGVGRGRAAVSQFGPKSHSAVRFERFLNGFAGDAHCRIKF